MKLNFRLRYSTLIVVFLLFAFCLSGFSQDVVVHKTVVGKILNFLSTNWELCSVVIVSEVLPLLPTKANGILQGAIRVLNLLFKKK